MTQDEIRERKLAGSTGDAGASPVPTDGDSGNCSTGAGNIQATANGRLAHAVSDCSTSDRIDSISGESVPGVDDASLGHVKISRRLAISRRDQAANS